MPIIVPMQLLKCLKVLLDENGGILSHAEVKRIAGLMTKFSKKLVSKCIYVEILKSTKTELLDEFMCVGGWALVYAWLNDAIRALNWPLVQEILELLLLCPVDVPRLRINLAPKIVKSLTRDAGTEGVKILARRLVDQWLKKVQQNQDKILSANTDSKKNTTGSSSSSNYMPPLTYTDGTNMGTDTVTLEPPAVAKTVRSLKTLKLKEEEDPLALPDVQPMHQVETTESKKTSSELVYRLVMKDGKQMLAKVSSAVNDTVIPSISAEETTQFDEESLQADNNNDDDAADLVEMDEGLDATVVDGANEHIVIDLIADDETDSAVVVLNKSAVEENLEESSTGDEVLISDMTEVAGDEVLNSDKRHGTMSMKDKKSDRSKEHRSSKDKDKDKSAAAAKIDKTKSNKKSTSNSHKSSSSSSSSSSASAHKSLSTKKERDSDTSQHSSEKQRSDKNKDKVKEKEKEKEKKSSSSSSRDKEKDKDKDRSERSDKERSSSKHRSSSSSSKSHSSSTSSKEKREQDKQKDKQKTNSSSIGSTSSGSSSRKERERGREKEKEAQAQKDKNTLAEMTAARPSIDKLGKIPKLSSITIPNKKSSMSIEVGREDKPKTVKTYNSQFRSHGLTEAPPPPPSRKDLKKPGIATNATALASPPVVNASTVAASLKRNSSPISTDRDAMLTKRSKIDLNYGSKISDKPGAIKLIPAPAKLPTLVETNLFSDALSASMFTKKVSKRKKPASSKDGKEATSPPATPDETKVTPPKFYTEATTEEVKADKENKTDRESSNEEQQIEAAADVQTEDDDDIPLKKVKEDIENQLEKKCNNTAEGSDVNMDDENVEEEKRKPGPGCGPDGPPGVLMLHRRKGPKKKLTWNVPDKLEQIRFFEVDETERVNVTKTHSFSDMLHMERFGERDAINIARRGLNFDDHMEPKTPWVQLIEVDDVPPPPMGSGSKQRKVQADREQLTLRALYFSHKMIPDSPSEPELEPHILVEIPLIPLEDITGNPDAVNDYTNMPFPAPKGFQNNADDLAGTGGLASIADGPDMFAESLNAVGVHSYNNSFGKLPPTIQQQQQQQQQQSQQPHAQQQQQLPIQMPQNLPPSAWQAGGPPPLFNGMVPPMRGNMFNGGMSMQGNGSQQNFMNGPNSGFGHGPPLQQNFMGPNGPQYGPGPNGFNGPPNNFGPMGPMSGPPIMNGMMGGPPGGGGLMMNNPHMGAGNNRNVFNNNNNNAGGNNWRNNNGPPNNNGICKAFMRGHCRNKACKYVHPKSKRI